MKWRKPGASVFPHPGSYPRSSGRFFPGQHEKLHTVCEFLKVFPIAWFAQRLPKCAKAALVALQQEGGRPYTVSGRVQMRKSAHKEKAASELQ